MKSIAEVCLVLFVLVGAIWSQDLDRPPLTKGISVKLASASHAVEMQAADKEDATVITLNSEGTIFLGVQPTELSALAGLSRGTVYLKADAQVQYQKLLSVLDAFHDRQVVLLTAPTSIAKKRSIVPPYGIRIAVAQ